MTWQVEDQFGSGGLWDAVRKPIVPLDHASIVRLEELYYSDPMDRGRHAGSTACQRNFVATWDFVDDRLFITHLSGYYRLRGDAPVFADWASCWLVAQVPSRGGGMFAAPLIAEAYLIDAGNLKDRRKWERQHNDAATSYNDYNRFLSSIGQ